MSDTGYSWGMTTNDTNTKGTTMTGYKILGIAEEGKCDCCGANCPKRRVAVATVSQDGEMIGTQYWGVICASKIRGERGNATDVQYLAKFARTVDAVRAAVAAGGGEREICRSNRENFPCDIRNGVVRMWASRHRGPHDAEIAMTNAA